MMAYEMGEIWHDDGEGESKVFDHDGHVVALCGTPEQARLIAESPERDDLLRELVGWLDGLLMVESNDANMCAAFMARIDATLRRSEV